eukprot:g4563.t1
MAYLIVFLTLLSSSIPFSHAGPSSIDTHAASSKLAQSAKGHNMYAANVKGLGDAFVPHDNVAKAKISTATAKRAMKIIFQRNPSKRRRRLAAGTCAAADAAACAAVTALGDNTACLAAGNCDYTAAPDAALCAAVTGADLADNTACLAAGNCAYTAAAGAAAASCASAGAASCAATDVAACAAVTALNNNVACAAAGAAAGRCAYTAPQCSAYTCAATTTHILIGAAATTTCTAATGCDDATCCTAAPTCDAHTCATAGNVLIAAAATTSCITGTCNDATCCAVPLKCNTHTCTTTGNVPIAAAATTDCAITGCVDATCCVSTAATCAAADTAACAAVTALGDNTACLAAGNCDYTAAPDAAACAAVTALGDNTACLAAGNCAYTAAAGAAAASCASAGAASCAATDVAACAAVTALNNNVACAAAGAAAGRCAYTAPQCSAYTCAATTTHILIGAAATTTCTAATGCDDATCCTAAPTCDAHTCATAGNVLIAAAATTSCITGTCNDATCCTVAPKCNTFTCAAGSVSITAAATTSCMTGTCNQATCCTASTVNYINRPAWDCPFLATGNPIDSPCRAKECVAGARASAACRSRVIAYCSGSNGIGPSTQAVRDPACFRFNHHKSGCPFDQTATNLRSPCNNQDCRMGTGNTAKCRAAISEYCLSPSGKADSACWSLLPRSCPFIPTNPGSPCNVPACGAGHIAAPVCRSATAAYCTAYALTDPACQSLLPGGRDDDKTSSCKFLTTAEAKAAGSPCFAAGGACMAFVAAGGKHSSASTYAKSTPDNFDEHVKPQKAAKITSITAAEEAIITARSTFLPGEQVVITGILRATVASQLNGRTCVIRKRETATTFSCQGLDTRTYAGLVSVGTPFSAIPATPTGFTAGGGTYSVPASSIATSGQGSGGAFSITVDGGNSITAVTVTAVGVGYAHGDKLTVDRTNLNNIGGISNVNVGQTLTVTVDVTATDILHGTGGLAYLAPQPAPPSGTSHTSRCRAVVATYCATTFASTNDPTCWRLWKSTTHGLNGVCPFKPRSGTNMDSPCGATECSRAFGSSAACRALVTDYCNGAKGNQTDSACYSLTKRGSSKAVTTATTAVTVTPAANSDVRISSGSTFAHCPFKADLATSPCKALACSGASGPRAPECRGVIAEYCSTRCARTTSAACADPACMSLLRTSTCPFQTSTARSPCTAPECSIGLKETPGCRAAVVRYCATTAGKADSACQGVFYRSTAYGAPEFVEPTPIVKYFKQAGSTKNSHNGFEVEVATRGTVTGGSWAVYENGLRPTAPSAPAKATWASGSYLQGTLTAFTTAATAVKTSTTRVENCKMMPTKTYWLYVEIHYTHTGTAGTNTYSRTSRAIRLRSPYDRETLPPIFNWVANSPLHVAHGFSPAVCGQAATSCRVGPRFNIEYVLREEAQQNEVTLAVGGAGGATITALANRKSTTHTWRPFGSRRRQLRLAGGHLVLRSSERGRLLHTNPNLSPTTGGDANIRTEMGVRGDAAWDTSLRERANKYPFYQWEPSNTDIHFTGSHVTNAGTAHPAWSPTTKIATGASRYGQCGVHTYMHENCWLAPGDHAVTVGYKDLHGHAAATNVGYTFTIDSVLPVVTRVDSNIRDTTPGTTPGTTPVQLSSSETGWIYYTVVNSGRRQLAEDHRGPDDDDSRQVVPSVQRDHRGAAPAAGAQDQRPGKTTARRTATGLAAAKPHGRRRRRLAAGTCAAADAAACAAVTGADLADNAACLAAGNCDYTAAPDAAACAAVTALGDNTACLAAGNCAYTAAAGAAAASCASAGTASCAATDVAACAAVTALTNNVACVAAGAAAGNCAYTAPQCGAYTCAATTTHILIGAAADTPCAADTGCTDATCCTAAPTCNSYTCATAGNVLIAAAATTSCMTGTCNDATCCTAAPKCNTFTCAAGSVSITAAATTSCMTGTCNQATCCTASTVNNMNRPAWDCPFLATGNPIDSPCRAKECVAGARASAACRS